MLVYPVCVVTIVLAIQDYHGVVLIDLLSYPTAPVTDFHTENTGLRPEHFLPSGRFLNLSAAKILAQRS